MHDSPLCACGQRAVWRRVKSDGDVPLWGSTYLCDFCWCDLVQKFPICVDGYVLVGPPAVPVVTAEQPVATA
jgi:hypothetical protein